MIKSRFGYSNADNPFGDSNLDKQFVWKEKMKQQDFALSEQDNQQIIEEIEKVKQRRLQRELESQRMEEDRLNYGKDREDQNYEQWLQKEKTFHAEQEKNRSNMRINQKRFILVDYFNLCVKHLKMMIKEKRDEVLTE